MYGLLLVQSTLPNSPFYFVGLYFVRGIAKQITCHESCARSYQSVENCFFFLEFEKLQIMWGKPFKISFSFLIHLFYQSRFDLHCCNLVAILGHQLSKSKLCSLGSIIMQGRSIMQTKPVVLGRNQRTFQLQTSSTLSQTPFGKPQV